jgi:glycosyltransferase involved in cell wall biosynthesis
LRIEDAVSVPKVIAVALSHRDMQPILAAMGGPEAPQEWQGALPIQYRLGGAATLRVKVDMQTDVQPNYVVEGRLSGSTTPDEWVVMGNHHDAWVFGGVDPSSGTATMMEMTRAFGQLKREGIRPQRTLVFCSWDGEEVTLTGSTEWGEQFSEDLKEKLVAYLNVDSAASGPHLGLSAVGSLAPMVIELTKELEDPSGGSLYEAWRRLGWPPVERATGPVDVVHATTILVPPRKASPLVVTVHDLAFRHYPGSFTRHGVHAFTAALGRVREHADLVLCSSRATLDDAAAAGLDPAKLRLVPLGIDPVERPPAAAVDAVRRRLGLADRPYLLFVGTLEPRKNLARLLAAYRSLDLEQQMVVVGPEGWGDEAPRAGERRLGFVDEATKAALYEGADAVCYPSLREGFGLPVLEAMAHGAPVVTSRGTATAEVGGDAWKAGRKQLQLVIWRFEQSAREHAVKFRRRIGRNVECFSFHGLFAVFGAILPVRFAIL